MKYRYVYKILMGLFFLFSYPLFAHSPWKNIKIHSHSAILLDAETKQILYQKNAFQKLPPASMTKVPTLLYAVKKARHQLKMPVKADQDCVGMITKEYREKMKYNYPPHWNVQSGTHLSIRKDEILKLEDLVYGMMISSANDAANMVAKYIGGTIPGFMKDLNEFLKEIGCKNTHLKNPHGMHFPNHHTTAYDMALITYEGLKDPLFREFFKAKEHQLPKTNKQMARKISSYNKLVKPGNPYYAPYVIGSKLGFHDQARGTLVAVAKKNGKTLIVVLLKSPKAHQKYEDAILLFNKGFQLLQ